jgi:undecaprenyl-diphosphatase
MLETLLSLDRELLIWARSLLWQEYSTIIQILWESIVIWAWLFLVWLWLFGLKEHDNRYKVAALMIFFTIIFTFVVYSIINLWFGAFRPNPQTILEWVKPLINHPTDNSFPSGHALFTGAFIVALVQFARYPGIIITTIIIGILTALCRIIGWVHYPGDILAGILFWLLGGYFFTKIVVLSFLREKIYFPIIRLIEYIRL